MPTLTYTYATKASPINEMHTNREPETCAICLNGHLSDTHIVPGCLHRICGNCVKESLMQYNDNCGICRLYTPPPRHVAVRDGLVCAGGDRQSWADSSLSQSSDGTQDDQHGSSTRQVRTFDHHFDELMEFKQKFGHCDVSRGASSRSLTIWCAAMRTSYWYRQIRIGEKPQYQLSAENIQRLEHNGFKWSLKRSEFDDCCDQLVEFKATFGHCNVPTMIDGVCSPLGVWCSTVRTSLKRLLKGQRPLTRLSAENIQRLEDISFRI